MLRILLIMLLLTNYALGIEMPCTVTTPTTNVDGTLLTDLALITINLESGQTGTIVTSATGTDVHYTFNLPEGTYCGVAYAHDTSGNISAPSNRICKTLSSTPLPPVQCSTICPTCPPQVICPIASLLPVVSFATTSIGRTSYGDIKWINTNPMIVSIQSITFSTTQFAKTTTIPLILNPEAIGRIGLKFQPKNVGRITGIITLQLSTGETVTFKASGIGR